MNRAQLSSTLADLFPANAVIAELRGAGDPALLLPAEAQFLGRAVPKRAQEFAAGRQCARRALKEFGMAEFAVEVAADRQPVWPSTLIGSITHTEGFCAAVVAERLRFQALGLDSEVVGAVPREVQEAICVADESAWLRSIPDLERPAAVTLIFSAKEAFYKCQYPLVGERLEFRDVRIEPVAWGRPSGTFRVHPMRRIELGARAAPPWIGEYLIHEGLVSAGVALASHAD